LLGGLIAAALWWRKAPAAAMPLCAFAIDIDDGRPPRFAAAARGRIPENARPDQKISPGG